MKNLLYLLFAIVLFSCSNSEDSNTEVDCNCIKTSYLREFTGASSNSSSTRTLGTEKVPCQDEETTVTTSSDTSGSTVYYYRICCSNIDNSIAGICKD